VIVGRRSFVRNTALVGAATAIANLIPLSSIVLSHAASPSGSPSQLNTAGTDMNSVLFKIDGWNPRDADAVSTPSSDPGINVAMEDAVWISINQSWRTAWR
jgi:hypothetical protein